MMMKLITLWPQQARKQNSCGFVSDLTQQLLPTILLDAYPAHSVKFEQHWKSLIK